jgi:hypothetical protein
MKSIGFPPGSNNFRLLMIVILVATLWVLFFYYTEQISIETEKASIQQTKNIINSTLAVVFATYAVKGELDGLNELNGGNPFIHLAEYKLTPTNYQGEIRAANLNEIDPGWYYEIVNKKVIYKSYFDDRVYSFSIVLDYKDVNGSGQFESAVDDYQRLYFK